MCSALRGFARGASAPPGPAGGSGAGGSPLPRGGTGAQRPRLGMQLVVLRVESSGTGVGGWPGAPLSPSPALAAAVKGGGQHPRPTAPSSYPGPGRISPHPRSRSVRLGSLLSRSPAREEARPELEPSRDTRAGLSPGGVCSPSSHAPGPGSLCAGLGGAELF